MEALGKKLQEARLRKKISLEEASRVTKIRASRLQEIENEDFSSFSSLAYAKGFLLIYGKYLEVDVAPYLDAFETSREVSVDGYSYLQDAPKTAPLPVVRRETARRPRLLPFFIAVAVFIFGLYLVKLLLDIQRIAPRTNAAAPTAAASITPTATAVPSPTPADTIVAPRAIPVEESPSEAAATAGPTETPAAVSATPSPAEPEIRRAQPVHPEDYVPPPTSPPVGANEVDVARLRLTDLRVKLDAQPHRVFGDGLGATDPPLSVLDPHVTGRVLVRGVSGITKIGAALAQGDEDITLG